VCIVLALEEAPSIHLNARNLGERRRVIDWINSKPELLEIVHAAEDARLGEDDWMRPPIEEFVRDELPHLWERYCAWLKTRTAATT